MTAQEIFDTVSRHLATQGGKSVKNGTDNCQYRGDGGRKCAVGALLTDEEYRPSYDENSVTVWKMAREGLLPTRLAPFEALLDGLQRAHDRAQSGEELIERLSDAAAAHNLSLAVLDTIKFPAEWK